MLGTLILRSMMQRNQAATVERKDIDAPTKMWADDVTLTLVGRPTIVGKPAVEAWYRSYFDRVETIREHSRNFAVTRPLALGFTNTVLWEVTGEHIFRDGGSVDVQSVGAVDFERGKATAIRVYMADPDIESAFGGDWSQASSQPPSAP